MGSRDSSKCWNIDINEGGSGLNPGTIIITQHHWEKGEHWWVWSKHTQKKQMEGGGADKCSHLTTFKTQSYSFKIISARKTEI